MSGRVIVCSVDHRPNGVGPGAVVARETDESLEAWQILRDLNARYPQCELRVLTNPPTPEAKETT